MKKPKKGHLNVIRLNCPVCSSYWDQRVIQTGLIETPCFCNVTMSMEVVRCSLGMEWIHTLFGVTKPLESLRINKVQLSKRDRDIADTGVLKIV